MKSGASASTRSPSFTNCTRGGPFPAPAAAGDGGPRRSPPPPPPPESGVGGRDPSGDRLGDRPECEVWGRDPSGDRLGVPAGPPARPTAPWLLDGRLDPALRLEGVRGRPSCRPPPPRGGSPPPLSP